MPSHEEALSIADICLFSCPSSLPMLHTRAKQIGGWPGQESFCGPEGRGGHWVMAFSSLAWGLLLLFSSTGIHRAPTVCHACARHSPLTLLSVATAGRCRGPSLPVQACSSRNLSGKSLSSLIKHHFFFFTGKGQWRETPVTSYHTGSREGHEDSG